MDTQPMAEVVTAEPRTRRAGSGFGRVGGGLFLLVLVMLGVLAFLYYRWLHYERVAALHLPADTVAAGRIDLEQVILFEPIRRHVMPILEESPRGSKPKPRSGKRLALLEERTGVNLALQLREVLVAKGPSAGDWTIVVGGIFPADGLVRGIHAQLTEEGFTGWTLAGGGRRMVHALTGLAVARADDGVLVMASDEARLGLALPQQSTHQTLGLELEGAAGFALRGDLIAGWGTGPLAFVTPALRRLAEVQRVHGEVLLGDKTQLVVHLDLREGADAKAMASDADALLGGLRALIALAPGTDWAGEAGLLTRAVAQAPTAREVELRSHWEREEIDRGAQTLAELIRGVMNTFDAP